MTRLYAVRTSLARLRHRHAARVKALSYALNVASYDGHSRARLAPEL